MSIVIRVEHLGKKYLIRHQQKERYTALRDVIAEKTKKIFSIGRRVDKDNATGTGNREEFWALKDVNFEVNRGDRVGIIGRNGAGKSTLLKILSRITEPTKGRISIKGRIASLLEVGTGFHPELTGRENIFLNGAILGMHRWEIKKKFDEIVDFSGVEKFLDTPVKRYSSGMYVRLAFAVAAHLESEILIVDEVLAVGDMEFQKKCLGKMQDVSQSDGRTVLFVSHNMTAVQSICNKGILLSEGKVFFKGSKNETIKKYISSSVEDEVSKVFGFKEGDLEFKDFIVFEDGQNKLPPFILRTGEKIIIKFSIRNNSSLIRIGYFNFEIKNVYGSYITCYGNEFNGSRLELKGGSTLKATIESEGINFVPGQYFINFYYRDDSTIVYKTNFISFEIVHSDLFGTGLLPSSEVHGVVISSHKIFYSEI